MPPKGSKRKVASIEEPLKVDPLISDPNPVLNNKRVRKPIVYADVDSTPEAPKKAPAKRVKKVVTKPVAESENEVITAKPSKKKAKNDASNEVVNGIEEPISEKPAKKAATKRVKQLPKDDLETDNVPTKKTKLTAPAAEVNTSKPAKKRAPAKKTNLKSTKIPEVESVAEVAPAEKSPKKRVKKTTSKKEEDSVKNVEEPISKAGKNIE